MYTLIVIIIINSIIIIIINIETFYYYYIYITTTIYTLVFVIILLSLPINKSNKQLKAVSSREMLPEIHIIIAKKVCVVNLIKLLVSFSDVI